MDGFQSAYDMKESKFPETILVLDTETTGLEGARFIDDPTADRFFKISRVPQMGGYDALDWKLYGDLVVDIGICEVDLKKGTVKDVYSAIVGYDTDSWTQEMEESWIFENTDLTIEQVRNGVPFSKVREEVSKIVKDRWLTTYNVQYDLDKFLYRFPWNIKGLFSEVRDIMFSAKDVCKLKSQYYGVKEYRYPKLDYAYKTILKGEDPAGINGVQDHRALSDARVASHLMIKMFNDGQYNPMDFSGRYSRD